MSIEEKVNEILNNIENGKISKFVTVVYCNYVIDLYEAMSNDLKCSFFIKDSDVFNYNVCKKLLEVLK